MAKLNTRQPSLQTHEGGTAKRINPELMLRRSVMACLLWEKNFYEGGVEIADRVKELIPQVDARKVAAIASEARDKMKLRHMPLLIAREMARHPQHKRYVADTLESIIQRADELTEFLAIYWQDGRQPLSAQVKKGIARAFTKFNAYQLAKYNRDGAVKLRDALFLSHAKPQNEEQAALWRKLIDGTLESPDTWEVSLSGGADKAKTFDRLMREGKLGGLALLRNLRNMAEAGVDEQLVFSALESMSVHRILPFRFITAARYAPQWESQIEQAMLKCLSNQGRLSHKTVLLVDVSGSMKQELSSRSEVTCMDAACGLAILLREVADVQVFTFSQEIVQVPSRHGFALRDAILNSQPHSATYLGQAVQKLNETLQYDRLVVITDEQSHDTVPTPKSKGYMINVAANRNGVGYGDWVHIDGWSESVLDYIRELEQSISGNSKD
ncbi:hypothetical protein LCGC14_1107800 [marine sediment metagenome]|uniref:TROVE domain-containing protein n=1 Tax=marine sediment metagenome TaxID=412755 RepID=A0A0F9MCC6_9ZZZZ